MTRNFTVLLMIFSCTTLFAQGQKGPAPSPHQVVTQDFAQSKIVIDYSRPGVKGRKVFGGIVPYGKEWRTGANAVTTLTFGQDIKLEGKDVKAGTYALYSIPTADTWTIILNKDVKNWGTEYKQADDVLRVTVPSYKLPVSVETFTLNIDSIRNDAAILYILWEHTYVPIHITTTTAGQSAHNATLPSKEEALARDEVPANIADKVNLPLAERAKDAASKS